MGELGAEATPSPSPVPTIPALGPEWQFLLTPEFWTAQAFALIIGIAAGMATGLIVWWYLTRRLRPRFIIHDTISVARDQTDVSGRRRKFRVKIENRGARAMRDVTVQAVFTYRKQSGNVQLLDLPVRSDPIAMIDRRSARTVHVKSESMTARDRSHFSPQIRRAMRRGVRVSPAVLLRDLGEDARLRVTVSAVDAVTAARTVEVREFTSDAITNEPFGGSGPK